MQRVRDEAHRFAVTFHRQRRSKSDVPSRLDDIPGVGPKRKKALIRHLDRSRGSRRRDARELVAVDGINRAIAEQIKSAL